ncbi:hypothetical protein HY387_01505 [Candidatus Daviesbacteria bacterium]|nr:hypothetical protein [Candidatus Daviesbacteria bacterium]
MMLEQGGYVNPVLATEHPGYAEPHPLIPEERGRVRVFRIHESVYGPIPGGGKFIDSLVVIPGVTTTEAAS